jgi:hypothetical protein
MYEQERQHGRGLELCPSSCRSESKWPGRAGEKTNDLIRTVLSY